VAIRPLFNKPFALVAFVATALAGCAVEPGPPGGERPALAAVPERPAPRYDAFERRLLRDALAAAAADARAARELVAARQAERPATAVAALPPPPAVPPEQPRLPPPAAELSPEENLVAADDLVALATAVLEDRRELARRARIQAGLEAPPVPAPQRVTTLVFPPASTTLTERERARLDRALARAGRDGAWLVRTGGALAEPRAAAARAALVAEGIAPGDIATGRLERDVDVAEIAVRR